MTKMNEVKIIIFSQSFAKKAKFIILSIL